MNYYELNKAEFDAIVTGELTHYAIWLENELVNIISDYFISDATKFEDFKRLLLFRDGLTFQDKIEIVRAMAELFDDKNTIKELKVLLNRIEKFKTWRNAMAHGHDVSEKQDKLLKVQIVSRSGKENVLEITPQSHIEKIEEAESLLDEIQNLRKLINS